MSTNATPAPSAGPISASSSEPSEVQTDVSQAEPNGRQSATKNPWGVPDEMLRQKFKLKSDGEEEEVELEKLLKERELSKASRKRMFDAFKTKEEADKLRGELEGFVQTLNEDPEAALRQLKRSNPKLRGAMEKLLLEEIQAEQLDPREREIHDLKRKLEEFESAKKQTVEQEEHAQLEQMKQQQRVQLEQKMISAVEEQGLPPNEETFGLMAAYFRRAVNAGYEPEMGMVAEQVREHLQTVAQRVLGKLPPQALMKLLGDAKMKEIRQADIARAKGEMTAAPRRDAPPPPPDKERPKLSEREFDERVRQLANR